MSPAEEEEEEEEETVEGPETSARNLHGVVDLPHGLAAFRVGAGPRAAAVHRAGAGEGGSAGAGQAGHAG